MAKIKKTGRKARQINTLWSGRQDLNLTPYSIFQCFLVEFTEKLLLNLIYNAYFGQIGHPFRF